MATRKYKYTNWTLGSKNPNYTDALEEIRQEMTPDWAKRTTTEQARVDAANNAYAKYAEQIEENKRIANTPEATPGFGSYASPAPVSPYENPNRVTPVQTSTQEGRNRLANSNVPRENETYAGWGDAPTLQDRIRLENKTPVREAETYGGIGNARTKEQVEAAWARAEADRASGRRIEETYAGWGDAPTKINRTRPYADQLNPNRRMQDTYEGWAEKKPVGLKIPVRENETYAGWGDFPTKGERRLAQDGDRFQNETYGGWGDAPTKQDRARLEGKTPAREMDEGYIEEHARMEAIRNRMANRIPIREEETYAGRVVLPEKQTNENPYSEYAGEEPTNTNAGKTNANTGSSGSAQNGSSTPTETESDYAKYYRENGYADREKQIEADYLRSLANYGVKAETLAQMGIHGGMSDYVNSAAYAQMQEQKAALGKEAYAEYAKHLDEKSAEDANPKLYNLLRNGTYTDEDGNTVQGYDLLNMSDEDYNANKPIYKADLKGQGYTDEQIDRAFSDIEATRAQNRAAETKRITDAFTKYRSGEYDSTGFLHSLGVTDEQIAAAAQNYAEQYKAENDEEISAEDAQSAVVGAAIIETVDNARKQGLLGEGDAGLKAESEFLRTRLPMYGDKYAKTGWKDRGYTLADSIEDALKYKEAGMMTEADVKVVINDALDKMFGKEAKEVKYVNTGNSVKIKIDGGEVLKADYAGKASESASAYLNEKYPNCPIAVYEGKLYYKAYENGNWMELKTKGGITPGFNRGTPEQGDQYFYVVAYAMMQKNDYPAFEDKDTTYKLN